MFPALEEDDKCGNDPFLARMVLEPVPSFFAFVDCPLPEAGAFPSGYVTPKSRSRSETENGSFLWKGELDS